MEATNKTRVYPAVERCIYCGTDKGDLSKEHIIPFGLAGNLILPKASCATCSAITARVEQFCLRQMLGPMRIRLMLPTRRPKERPEEFPLEFIHADGRREETKVPTDKVPFAFIGYRFAAPGLLRGVAPSAEFDGELVARFLNDEIREYATPDGQRVKIGAINILEFSRMLAKIAHSYAVAEIGLAAFQPLLPDLILGKSDLAPYLVGGDASGPPPIQQAVLHDIYRQHCLTNGVEYVLVAIRLFAFAGMPRYHVVVGQSI